MVKKLFRFVVSGGSAAVINLALFFLFEHVLNVSYLLAVIVSNVCASAYNFLIQKVWVFDAANSGMTKGESYLFFIVSVLNLILNEMLLMLFIGILAITPFISQFISLGLLAFMNYVLYQNVIFVRKSESSHRLHQYLERIKMKHILIIVALSIALMCILYAAYEIR